MQTPQEKAKLLRMVLSNCAVDAVSVYPTYRKPFDMIFERANQEWWTRGDSNPRPPHCERGHNSDKARRCNRLAFYTTVQTGQLGQPEKNGLGLFAETLAFALV